MDERTVLRKAKGVLLERGWHQGGFAGGALGDGPVCLAGACNVAATGDAYNLHRSNEAFRALERFIGAGWIAKWNDEVATSVDDVIGLIDRALGSLPAEAPELEKAVA